MFILTSGRASLMHSHMYLRWLRMMKEDGFAHMSEGALGCGCEGGYRYKGDSAMYDP